MPPRWLTVVAWISLAGAVVTAAAIGFDIYGRGLRQKLAVMEAVWPVTALYFGPFGWMAVMQLVLFTQPHLTPAHAAYWFLMQIGMVLGFITAYPVNVWLLRRGIKEAM